MVFAISFVVYTLGIVALGVYSSRFARNTDEDYFLAGRKLGPWVAALSASASSESGWVTLGLVGLAFRTGVRAYWIIPGCLLGYLFNWFVLAGRLRDRSAELGALTVPDFLGLHFRERRPVLRVLTVIVILTAMWLYVAAQFAAAGKAFHSAFDDLPYWAGVVIGAAIVLLYTIIGGFRAVCWTDLLQGIVMAGTLAILPLYLFTRVGGPGGLCDALSAADPALVVFRPRETGAALLGFLLGGSALGINFGFPGQPHILVRFMALGRRKDAAIAGVISVVWALLIFWGAVTIGLVVRAMTENGAGWTGGLASDLANGAADAGEVGLVLAARNLLPGMLSGMVLAAVLAAICSTADSQLVVAASAGANDLYARIVERGGRTGHMIVNRAVVFALGIAAVLLVINEKVQVFRYVLEYGWAVLGAAIGPQVILALLWKRASYAGAIAGMVTGFVLALTWNVIYDAEATGVAVYNLPVAFAAAMVVNAIVSLLRPGEDASAPFQGPL